MFLADDCGSSPAGVVLLVHRVVLVNPKLLYIFGLLTLFVPTLQMSTASCATLPRPRSTPPRTRNAWPPCGETCCECSSTSLCTICTHPLCLRRAPAPRNWLATWPHQMTYKQPPVRWRWTRSPCRWCRRRRTSSPRVTPGRRAPRYVPPCSLYCVWVIKAVRWPPLLLEQQSRPMYGSTSFVVRCYTVTLCSEQLLL
jgi:hypothetical protein